MGLMNSGVKQWVFQRIANALFVTFGICLLCVFLSAGALTFDSVKSLLADFKWYFVLVLIFASINAVLAAWQIDGDYAKKFGIPVLVITVTAALISVIYLIYGLRFLFA